MSDTLFDLDALNADTLFNYDEASTSPTNTFFPSFNFQDDSRLSISSASDAMYPYLSRPPSLSPASQSAQLLHPSFSPPSSASPRSVFSASTTDDMMLSNTFSSAEIDKLLSTNYETDSKQPFYLPHGTADNVDLFALLNASLAQQQQQEQQQQQLHQQQQQIQLLQQLQQQQFSQNLGQSIGTYTQPFQQNWTNVMDTVTLNNPPVEVVPKVEPEVTADVPVRKTKKSPARPPVPRAKSDTPEERPVGKHNKTERRYRQKVQMAQANLRDSVPALRVLYGTSTDEQKQTTDFKADDGTVDGLGEINRPNASAKTTIFVGARLYIELLQQRNATLQRKVDELETFRSAVAGEDNTKQWRIDFDTREADLQASMIKPEEDSFDESDESEEEPKRKKAKMAKAKKADLRAFAAFAASFAFFPSTSTVLQPATIHTYEQATTSQVIRRMPFITAEHTSRLLARALPAAMAPGPMTLIDWTCALIVAMMVYLVVRSMRFTRTERHAIPVGRYSALLKDIGRSVYSRNSVADPAWVQLASRVVGGVTSLTALERYHLALRLNLTAQDAQTLALLALFQPTLPLLRPAVDVWAIAKGAVTADTPISLRQVLALDLDEARRALHFLPVTASPITALAEQVTLVHLNDLYSRLFVQLVEAATQDGRDIPVSIKALVENIECMEMSKSLRSTLFDKEIRGVVNGVPRGTAAHAIGLVLIGLWGIICGSTPASQAALASALAAEEIKGVGASLSSVTALRELLYPNSSLITPTLSAVPANAVTIDKLAMVCISFIQLLTTPAVPDVTRTERLANSRQVSKAASQIRLVLTNTSFAGMEDEVEVRNFDEARERLVTVLARVGRRAAGRACGRDQDSGLEGDLDDL